MARLFVIAALAAALAACAGTPEAESQVHCVDWHLVAIGAGRVVHMVPGRCKAWSVGPTPRQRQEFDKRAAARGGL